MTPTRDSRLNASAYGTMTSASGSRAWLSGYVHRFNRLDDDLHAVAAILAKKAEIVNWTMRLIDSYTRILTIAALMSNWTVLNSCKIGYVDCNEAQIVKR